MSDRAPFLMTGVGGGYSSISRLVAELLLRSGEPVRAMVHRDDGRADALRELGADIVVGDLTRPGDVICDTVICDMFTNASRSPRSSAIAQTTAAASR